MTRRWLAVVALLVLRAAPLVAQSHPCDLVAPTVYREPSSQLSRLRLGWCFAPYDTDGVPLGEAVGFALQVNGGADIDLGLVAPSVGPNAQGLQYYEAQTPALAAGVITLRAYTATLGMSGGSVPVTLTLLGAPRAPQNTTITR